MHRETGRGIGRVSDQEQDIWRKHVEQQLAKLSEAVIALARVEERMTTVFNRMGNTDADNRELTRKLDLAMDRIAALERVSFGRGLVFQRFDKVGFLMLGAAIAAGIDFVKTKLGQ